MEEEVIVLASRSPRRVQLLEELGQKIIVIPADIDESPHTSEPPVDYVRRLALEKAHAVAPQAGGRRVLAADTTVDMDGTILGQPVDESDARRMLRLLSGRTHRVHTGVAVVEPDGSATVAFVTSLVTFVPVTDELLDWYIATGEWQGKAGSYAVQGQGAVLVAQVRGPVSNVIGLPLGETARLMGLVAPSAD